MPKPLLLALMLASAWPGQAAVPEAAASAGCRDEAAKGSERAARLPALTGRVVDQADLLSPSAEARVTEALAAIERRTSDQVVVVTVGDLEGEAIEAFGLRLGNGWGIGRKDVNNGILLIVAPNERRVRIEVGSGLEGLLTDERAKRIIEEELLPRFASRQYEEGIRAGVGAIDAVISSDLKRPQLRRKEAA